jgi:hypothetical protein
MTGNGQRPGELAALSIRSALIAPRLIRSGRNVA